MITLWRMWRVAAFAVGMALGAAFAVYLFGRPNYVHRARSEPYRPSRPIKVFCMIGTTNFSGPYPKAIVSTWARSCSGVRFYDVSRPDRKSSKSKKTKRSSFHALCSAIREFENATDRWDWALFVNEETFAVPENLGPSAAGRDPNGAHYLGHSVNFWNTDYNSARAGFALSRGAVRLLLGKFPTEAACRAGGNYWKQEDLYLGQHLRSLGVRPADVRDRNDNAVFLGYDLDKMMFRHSVQNFSNYFLRAVRPVKCCGDRTVAFQVLSSTEMYKYHYMIYTMRANRGSSVGDPAAPKPVSDDSVWKDFLRERGLPTDISSREYEKSWYVMFDNTTVVPGALKKDELDPKETQKMSEILDDIFKNYTDTRGRHRGTIEKT